MSTVELVRLPDLLGWSDELPVRAEPAWCWFDTPERDFGWRLMVRCEHGHWGTLSPEKHAVGADGRVVPSIHFRSMCPGHPDWHVYGRLQGWTPGDTARRLGP